MKQIAYFLVCVHCTAENLSTPDHHNYTCLNIPYKTMDVIMEFVPYCC